jgi:hypothetical protein
MVNNTQSNIIQNSNTSKNINKIASDNSDYYQNIKYLRKASKPVHAGT